MNEKVNDKEVNEFCEQIGAYHCITSASNNKGINELFREMGKRFLDPNYNSQEQKKGKSQGVKLSVSKIKHKDKKKC